MCRSSAGEGALRVGASIERRGGEEPVVRRERVGSWESVAMADGDGVLVVVEMEEEDIARVSPARADSDAGHRLQARWLIHTGNGVSRLIQPCN